MSPIKKFQFLAVNGRTILSGWLKCVSSFVAALFMLAMLASPGLAQPKKADLSRLVVIGDSLSAGFQNGSLEDSQQVHGYANLIAQQAGTPLVLPFIAPPGIPNVLELVSPGPPPIIVQAPGTSIGRDDPLVQVTDLAVPGANLQDVLSTVPSLPIDDFTDLILGLPGLLVSPPIALSQAQWAQALEPTTIIVWIGNNDALGAVVANDLSLLTPVPQFRAEYAQLMDELSATGAAIVVANVPDVTIVPFLTPFEDVVEQLGLPVTTVHALLGINPGDFVTPSAFPLILEILANPSLGPLPESVVFRAGQVAQVRAAVRAYDAIIAEQAAAHGAALVDIRKFTSEVQANGLAVNGERLTTEFLGGIFSLDGIHPTNTGYAAIANDFIQVFNRQLGTHIPPVSLSAVAASDPLVFPNVEPPDSALRAVSPEMTNSLRRALARR